MLTVRSCMKRSDGCDWLDRPFDWAVWMNRGFDLVLCGVPKLGTPGDVAQRDQILKFFQRLRCVGICLVF